jgi:hypothetical protein
MLGIPGDVLEPSTLCPPSDAGADYNCPVCFQHTYCGSDTLVMCETCESGAHAVRKACSPWKSPLSMAAVFGGVSPGLPRTSRYSRRVLLRKMQCRCWEGYHCVVRRRCTLWVWGRNHSVRDGLLTLRRCVLCPKTSSAFTPMLPVRSVHSVWGSSLMSSSSAVSVWNVTMCWCTYRSSSGSQFAHLSCVFWQPDLGVNYEGEVTGLSDACSSSQACSCCQQTVLVLVCVSFNHSPDDCLAVGLADGQHCRVLRDWLQCARTPLVCP